LKHAISMILFLVSIEIHQETYMDPLLTAAEVAERVRGQEATVRFWRATGVLYKQSDVEAWIESQFAKATVG
jgi:hypothetical protein